LDGVYDNKAQFLLSTFKIASKFNLI